MQVDSDSETEAATAPAKGCPRKKPVMTAVKQVPARVPEAVSTKAAAPDAAGNAAKAELPRVPEGAVPKSLAGALPAVPAPPSHGPSHSELPPEILAKLRELEEMKAKYAAALLKAETGPDSSFPPTPAQRLRKDSAVSPPEQKQLFTPETPSQTSESVVREALGEKDREEKSEPMSDGVAKKPLPPPVDEEILQEAYNLEHKDASALSHF
eukprot:s1524_g13.t1